jgi:uncharacterized membrane protein YqiK
LEEGRIIALAGEAGLQATPLRGGLHFGYPLWQYSIHTVPLVTIGEGRMGYVYARDGAPLEQVQTLARSVPKTADPPRGYPKTRHRRAWPSFHGI